MQKRRVGPEHGFCGGPIGVGGAVAVTGRHLPLLFYHSLPGKLSDLNRPKKPDQIIDVQCLLTGYFCTWEQAIVRPFLIQSDLSVENGLFRLKPKSGFLTQSKKGFIDSTFFPLRTPTGESSRKDRLFRLDFPLEKLSPKKNPRVF